MYFDNFNAGYDDEEAYNVAVEESLSNNIYNENIQLEENNSPIILKAKKIQSFASSIIEKATSLLTLNTENFEKKNNFETSQEIRLQQDKEYQNALETFKLDDNEEIKFENSDNFDLGPEPSQGIEIKIRFNDGSFISRKFLPNDSCLLIYKWVSQEKSFQNFELKSATGFILNESKTLI